MTKKLVSFDAFDYNQLSSSANSTLESEVCTPFSFYSSSIGGVGYLSRLQSNFRGEVEINDIHFDAYPPDNETPMQSPFTEKYVGGLQYRHQFNLQSSSIYNRAEGWKVWPSGGKLYIKGPDSFGAQSNSSRHYPRGVYYRDGLAKRPVNIKNILSGNYWHDYEVVSTSGRYFNNLDLIHSGGYSSPTTSSAYINHLQEYTKRQRQSNDNVIVERFSCPGEPATAGDDSGGYGLDYEAAEYSVYNSVNFRNLLVRQPLNTLLTRRMGQFGTDSECGAVFVNTYNSSASFHKTHYNTWTRMELSGATSDSYFTASKYDNWFVQHPIPEDDSSYTWLRACSYLTGTQAWI